MGEQFETFLYSSVTSVFKTFLQNISRQILILHNIRQHLPHIIRIHGYMLAFSFRSIEAQLVQHSLHDGMQPPRSNILRTLIHPKGKMCDFR